MLALWDFADSMTKQEDNMEGKNYFQVLNDVNVGDKAEKKNGLTYLSWAWAWAEIKKRFPDAFYTIYENADGGITTQMAHLLGENRRYSERH